MNVISSRITNALRRIAAPLLLIAVTLSASCLSSGCGTIRTYGGIEHEYEYDIDGHRHYKPGKHKKHKKNKKNKKHHRHHHHDDD